MPQVASSTTDTPMSPLARRLTLLALVIVAALFVRLGFWQLGRLGNVGPRTERPHKPVPSPRASWVSVPTGGRRS